MAEPEPPTTAGLADDLPASKQKIDPYNVSGEIGADGVAKAIDYNKLIEEFGTKRILEEDLKRFEKVTGHKPHRFMRRGIVFSHRDLNLILDRHERGEPFFLYTGRGPSSDSMHIGHTVPFDFTKYMQDVFDVPLIIMMTDDEKFIFGPPERTIEDVQRYTQGNAKDIIAAGFDPKKTFIFGDYDFMGGAFYRNVTRMSKCITANVASAIFGFDGSSNVGKYHFGAIQGATCFANSFPHIFGENESITSQIPCMIPCAIDQDPYFRLARDVAARLHFAKPALIHSSFLDALQGPGTKMSASIDSSAIFMKDTPSQIKNKVNKYAFSGGQATAEEQRQKGGNPDVDVSFNYLKVFLEDDEELAKIKEDYTSGKILTGELKALCIQHLQEYVKAFQERREQITDEVMEDFFARKKLAFKSDLNAKVVSQTETGLEEQIGEVTVGEKSKKQKNKEAKEAMIAEKKAAKEAEKAAKVAAKPAT